MIDKLVALDRLLKTLQRIPYLASRNVYRVADYFLSKDIQFIQQFCEVLLSTRNLLSQCTVCYCWQEKDKNCIFCTAPDRQQGLICVVETWHELMSIEKTKGYDGVYHVLGGVISPIEGVGPDALSINALFERVRNGADEVILATNQTPEGEATAAYIAHKLKPLSVKITCLARGLPVGALLEGIDRVTVFKALSERRLF
ncbi:MAG TPA: recombination mediator RecR [Candidatus Babeliales bacterium]|jgi:recombination protein RecR|nr:recombination mediator RecR [Candidatus Babeliales bacterium]